MKYIYLLQIVVILTFTVKSHLCYDEDEDDDSEWYQGRHIIGPRARALILKRGPNGIGITISSGVDKDKKITVPNCGTTSIGIISRIVGGSDARTGQFPWIVLIETNRVPFCGGTILNEKWIVSAAHCFKGRTSPKGLSIRVGSIKSDQGVYYKISKLVIHDKYNWDGMENSDLALLKTASPIKMERDGEIDLINGVNVCLPHKPHEEPISNKIIVAGWGRVGENQDPSRTLKYVKLDLTDITACATKFAVPMEGYPNGYKIYPSQMCALTYGKDACLGDSGGPAIQYQGNKAVLVGVVSFGIGCATHFPGVYTKVSHFTEWMANNMD